MRAIRSRLMTSLLSPVSMSTTHKLVVITGVSGSGKSSLAFDTLYGQRRLLASMSAFAKRFVNQLRKPDMDFVHGLSPVISIDRKTVGSNPRSAVGTMTDLWDYLRMLYATLGTPYFPRCQHPVSTRSPQRMFEHLLDLPTGTEVEVRAPVFEIYGGIGSTCFDEPSIGLHPKDNVKMIRTLERLRDLGNTVIVVEHDEETVRAADWLVEIGPGPGTHGGQVVASGPPSEVLANARSSAARNKSPFRRSAVSQVNAGCKSEVRAT
jgi:excinuclease ABC subunit A